MQKGVFKLAYTEAGKRAVAKYSKANYDNLNIRVPKGKKAVITSHAQAENKSLNSFVNEAIDEKIVNINK